MNNEVREEVTNEAIDTFIEVEECAGKMSAGKVIGVAAGVGLLVAGIVAGVRYFKKRKATQEALEESIEVVTGEVED